MRRAIWRRESDARERSPKAISPPEGSSSPVRQRRRVVFPAPLGPTTARHSPRRTSRSRGPRMARAPERQASPRALRRTVILSHTSLPALEGRIFPSLGFQPQVEVAAASHRLRLKPQAIQYPPFQGGSPPPHKSDV